MISIENVEVWGWEHAIRGMRNPYESWDRSDSVGDELGINDLKLAKSLFKAGTEHRKFMRQIFVCMDITAPLYWWKEFDTYKVGTVANSSSTMHLIASRPLTLEDFSIEHLGYYDVDDPNGKYASTAMGGSSFGDFGYYPTDLMVDIIEMLNLNREKYLETKDKLYWWQMIQLLPSSYNQRRTVTMNYENVASIIKQRTGHKLDEWHDLIEVFNSLPFVPELVY
jgi:hypothetical protein